MKRRMMPIWLSAAIVIAAIVICAVIELNARAPVPEGELYVRFIDVGQGDAALLLTSEAAVLIDAGPSAARYELSDFVSRYTDRIDLMILSHPHEDHIGGAAHILRTFGVERVLVTDAISSAGAFERFLDAVEETKTPTAVASVGDIIDLGALRLTVLGPVGDSYTEENDFSLVVRADFGKTSFLFTGDAEIPSERDMIERHPLTLLDCDVLKVGHHGSESSSSEEFLAVVRPNIAVISVGRDNDYGHPKDEILSRLARFGAEQIFRTDRDSTVTLFSDGERVMPTD